MTPKPLTPIKFSTPTLDKLWKALVKPEKKKEKKGWCDPKDGWRVLAGNNLIIGYFIATNTIVFAEDGACLMILKALRNSMAIFFPKKIALIAAND